VRANALPQLRVSQPSKRLRDLMHGAGSVVILPPLVVLGSDGEMSQRVWCECEGISVSNAMALATFRQPSCGAECFTHTYAR
jgi:hypothetical protein